MGEDRHKIKLSYKTSLEDTCHGEKEKDKQCGQRKLTKRMMNKKMDYFKICLFKAASKHDNAQQ